MGFTDYCKIVLDLIQNGVILLFAMIYRITFFMVFLSASIGPSVLLCRLYNHVFDADPLPQVVEPMLCMILVRCWAQFSITIENRTCAGILRNFRNKYPNTMTFGCFAVELALFLWAFWNMFVQFEAAHTFEAIPPTRRKGRESTFFPHDDEYPIPYSEGEFTSNSLTEDYDRSREVPTAIFQLSLAYLVFVCSRTFHETVVRTIQNLPSAFFSIMSNFLIRVGFGAIHLLANGIYFIPCLAIGYTSRTYRTTANTLYFQMSFTAGLSGMIAALFELNKPWPKIRAKMPFLYYENNLITKDKMSIALVFLILIAFYRPLSHGKVPQYLFDSTNYDALYFCMSVAFTVLHVVKFSMHSVLSLAQEYEDDRARDNRIIPVDQLIFTPSLRSLRNSSELPSGLVGESNAGQDGMCQRCSDNVRNNNTVYEATNTAAETLIPATNDNNNNAHPERVSSKPQSETELVNNNPQLNGQGASVSVRDDVRSTAVEEAVEAVLINIDLLNAIEPTV